MLDSSLLIGSVRMATHTPEPLKPSEYTQWGIPLQRHGKIPLEPALGFRLLSYARQESSAFRHDRSI